MTVPSQPPPLLPPRQSSRHLPLIVSLSVAGAAVTVLIVLVVVGVVVLMAQPNIEGLIDHGGTTADGAGEAVVQDEGPGFDPAEVLRQEKENQRRAADEAERERQTLEAGQPPRQGPAEARDPNGDNAPKVAANPKPKPPSGKRDPLADIKDRGNVLLLPSNNVTDILATKAPKRLLATLYTDDLSSCRLELEPGVAGIGQKLYFLKEKSAEDKRIRIWSVIRAPKKHRGVGGDQDAGTPIAVFELERKKSKRDAGKFEQALTFRWSKGVGNAEPEIIQLMELEIGVGKHTASCELIRRLECDSIAIKFDGKKELGPNLNDAGTKLSQSQDRLLLDLKLNGFEAGALVSRTTVPMMRLMNVTKNWKEAPGLLTGIPLDNKIDIIVRRKWKGTSINALVVTVGLVGGGEKKRPAALTVRWYCKVLAQGPNGVVVSEIGGYSLAASEKGLTRAAGLQMAHSRNLVTTNKALVSSQVTVARCKKLLSGNLSANQKLAVLSELKRAQRNVDEHSSNIRNIKQRVQELKAAEPYLSGLYDAMKRHHGRATIEWRIYLSKGGKTKTLAVSTNWLRKSD